MKETTNKYIEDFGETSEGWSIKSLGEIADIYRGASPRPIKDPKWFSEKSTHGWIRISDVTKSKKYLLKTEQYLSPDGINNSRTVSSGDLIMSICGTIGRPIILKINACIHDGFVVFSNLKEHLVDTEYLRYTILTLTEYFKSQGQPGTQVNLNTSIVEKAKVLLPPLKEQQKIAEILSTVDEQIEQTEKLIEKTKELKRGLMQQLLTKGIGHTEFKPSEFGDIPEQWEVKSLKEIVDCTDRYSFAGGPFGSDLTSKEYTEKGVQVIQLQNIGDGYFIDKSKVFVSDQKADELSKCNIYPGEIIISKMADPVARACIIPKKANRYLMASDGIRVKVNTKVNDTKYIMYFVNSEYFRGRAVAASTGSTRIRIGLTTLGKLPLLVPKLKEQKKIASILSTVDEKIESYEKENAKYEELKKGLMQQLLTGKVRVKVD